jgi:hypothetical protein
MLFVPPNVKSNRSSRTVTGYALALSRAPASERAFTAAKLVNGQVSLVQPRTAQAARLARVSIQYVKAALEILGAAPEFEPAVCTGELSLFEAAVLATHPEPTLAEKFRVATATERAIFAKAAGPAVLWDELIVPHI